MPKRKAAQYIVVQRGDKRVKVQPGETFDFTAEELEDIKRMNKDAIHDPVDAPVEKEVKMPGGGKPAGGKPAADDGKDDL